MKQNNTRGQSRQQTPKQSPRQSWKQASKQSPKQSKKICEGPITIGIDLGDKTSRYCLLNNRGEVVKEASGRLGRPEQSRWDLRLFTTGVRLTTD